MLVELLALLAPEIDKLPLPLGKLKEVSGLHSLIAHPVIKSLLPFPLMVAIGAALYLMLRKTWVELEREAARERLLACSTAVASVIRPSRYLGRYRISPKSSGQLAFGLAHVRAGQTALQRWRLRDRFSSFPGRLRARWIERFVAGNRMDYRPAVCLVLAAAILTIQEYYGGRSFYERVLKPELVALDAAGWEWLKFGRYQGLYSYAWWTAARILGYVAVPLLVWKLVFPSDNLLDHGFRVKGFWQHLWIYAALLAIVVPVMFIVAQQPDFGSYYPFYKSSSRSWFDLLAWEVLYIGQFFALEFFFRGWMIGAMRRSLGVASVFVMAVPYCMIHYGKPYLEAHGAIIAGVVLGTLSMKTRSIYAGFLLHISVALGMDLLSLYKRGALPTVFWPQ